MKKIIIFAISILLIIPVYAADFSTSLSGNNSLNAGDTISLTFYVNGNNIWGVQGQLQYDTSKLQLVGSSGINGWTATVGSSIVLDRANGSNGNSGAATLKFKALSLFKPGESVTINVINVKGSSDSAKFTGSNCSKKITINIPKSSNNNLNSITIDGKKINGFDKNKTSYDLGKTDGNNISILASTEDNRSSISGTGSKTLNYGDNNFNITVKAENGSIKTYSIRIYKNDYRSTNNNLSTLSVDKGNIEFKKEINTYNLVVDNKVETVNISGNAEDSKSKIDGLGEHKLNVYLNVINIVVTAENGSTKTYRINISRKDEDGNRGSLSTNNRLSNLSIEGYDIKFNPDVTEYSLSVNNDVENISLNYKVSDSNSSIKVDKPDKLKVGMNYINIEITAQSGNVKNYTISIIRKDDTPTLTLKDFKSSIETTTNSVVNLELKDGEDEIGSASMNKMVGKDTTLNINKYDENKLLYTWTINGKDIKEGFDFNTIINFENSNENVFDNSINYAEHVYIKYEEKDKLPINTKVKVYVGDKFKNNSTVKLYSYDEKTGDIELVLGDLQVVDGYIEYEVDNTKSNIITQSNLKPKKEINIFLYIAIIEFIIILSILMTKIIKRRKEKNKNRLIVIKDVI